MNKYVVLLTVCSSLCILNASEHNSTIKLSREKKFVFLIGVSDRYQLKRINKCIERAAKKVRNATHCSLSQNIQIVPVIEKEVIDLEHQAPSSVSDKKDPSVNPEIEHDNRKQEGSGVASAEIDIFEYQAFSKAGDNISPSIKPAHIMSFIMRE